MVHMQPAGPAVFGSEAASMRSHGSLIFDIEVRCLNTRSIAGRLLLVAVVLSYADA